MKTFIGHANQFAGQFDFENKPHVMWVTDPIYPTGGQILGAQTGEVSNYSLPPSQQPDWNTQWNQTWNDYFNQGYNRQYGPMSWVGGSGPFATAQNQGYQAGLNSYLSKNPTTTSTTNNGGAGNGSGGGGNPVVPTSELNQLLAEAQSPGGLNPVKKGRLAELLGFQQQQTAAQQAADLASQINDNYQPQLNWLSDMAKQNETNKTTALTSNADQYNRELGQIPGQQQLANQQIDNSQQNLNNAGQSAYDQAVQAYNALSQQRNAKFGQGSSAGGAVGELAARQFAQGQAQVGQQQLQGQQSIEQNRTALNNYVQKKKDDLATAKQAAEQQINTTFQNQLTQIQGNQYATEQAKTKDKLNALNNAIAQRQAIEAADRQFNLQIGQFAAQQYTAATGQAFTPQMMQQWINPQYTTQFSQSGSAQAGNPLATAAGGVGRTPDYIKYPTDGFTH